MSTDDPISMGCELFAGLVLRDVSDGERRVVEMDITDDVRGPSRAIHGGVISTLIDFVGCSVLYRLERRPVATSTLNINFLNPAREGPIRASAEVVRRSQHHGVAEVRIVDTGRDDRLVATATVHAAFLSGETLERRT